MASQTTHFDMVKQQSPERVSVGLLNDNFDIIDGVMFANQEKSEQLADDYNASETYNTGDYVRRENYLYKCNTDNTTGTWDDTKWDRVKVMDEITQGGGGGSSTLAGLNDVNISSPTDGQALVYDNATQKWVNGAGGGGSSTFAGLNDVNVTGVQNGDIARYNSTTGKWEASDDLTDLELSVSQLSSSVLSIAGDVDALELTVSQMSASTLPYDANTSTKQKIDNVESSIPTSASDLPYSNTQSTKQKIDEIEETIVLDIPANTYSTYALALNALNNAFSNLTQSQREKSYIVWSDQLVCPMQDLTNRAYANISIQATPQVSCRGFYLNDKRYIMDVMVAGRVDFAEYTNNAQSVRLTLKY